MNFQRRVGILQFFIAKKAAARLKAFASRYYEDQLIKEQKQIDKKLQKRQVESLPMLPRKKIVSTEAPISSPQLHSPHNSILISSPKEPIKFFNRSVTSGSPGKLASPRSSNTSQHVDRIYERRKSKKIAPLDIADIERQNSTKFMDGRYQRARPSSSALLVRSS